MNIPTTEESIHIFIEKRLVGVMEATFEVVADMATATSPPVVASSHTQQRSS